MLPTRRAILNPNRSFRATVTVTPVAGAELVTNWNMETGNPPTGWLAAVATLTGVADERTGGAGVQSLSVANSGAAAGVGYRAITVGAGSWLLIDGWAKKLTSNVRLQVTKADMSAAMIVGPTISAVNWTESIFTGRVSQANPLAYIQLISVTAGHAAQVDDFSVKLLSLPSLLALAGDPGTMVGTFCCAPTLTAGTQCGMMIGVDNPLNPKYGLLLTHDGTNAHLEKLVNGTWTSLINAAAAYAALRQLKVVHLSGNTYSLWYNSVQIGANQTVDTTGFGNAVCGFSTLAGNLPGTIVAEV